MFVVYNDAPNPHASEHCFESRGSQVGLRIGSLPATTVSPTTANSDPRPLLSHGRQSTSTTMLRTLRPMRVLVPTALKASRPVFCDSMMAGTARKNGSALRPAYARRPSLSPCSSLTRKRVVSPDGARHRPSCTGTAPAPPCPGVSNWKVKTSS